jgi:hypothetical protein
MDARVNEVIHASRLMTPDQAGQASAEGYFATTVMHEICHGLGSAFARRDGRRVDIREALGGIFGAVEEANADIVSLFALQWLLDRGVLRRSRLEEYYASDLAGSFRTVWFGTGEAHGRAEMMELNFLTVEGAIVQDGGRYRVDSTRIGGAIERLAKELLEQEATGDRARRGVVRSI